jgi:hypothetical protein
MVQRRLRIPTDSFATRLHKKRKRNNRPAQVNRCRPEAQTAKRCAFGAPESKRPQDPTGDEKPTEGLRKRKQDFSTPYAPAVLTLWGPSSAIPLG